MNAIVMTTMTVFYDGLCPLCVKEMKHLAGKDISGSLTFYDINQAQLAVEHPDIDYAAANAYLHAKMHTGEVITGLDVTYQAWQLVGKGWLIAPLRWPVIKIIADKAYLVFAKHRYGISKMLTGKSRCDGACEIRSNTERSSEVANDRQ